MYERTTDKRLSTPAVARNIATRAIKSVDENPIGSFLELITARVFTAFMFEGVIHHLGDILCSTWSVPQPHPDRGWFMRCLAYFFPKFQAPRGGRPPLARQQWVEKHKTVRRFLNLDNGGKEYQDIQPIAQQLFDFRDALAHPKLLKENNIKDFVPTSLAPLPQIGWEVEINASKIKTEYQQIDDYCIHLLDTAAKILEETYEGGWDASQQRYPHLNDLGLEAMQLRGFLHSARTSISKLSC